MEEIKFTKAEIAILQKYTTDELLRHSSKHIAKYTHISIKNAYALKRKLEKSSFKRLICIIPTC